MKGNIGGEGGGHNEKKGGIEFEGGNTVRCIRVRSIKLTNTDEGIYVNILITDTHRHRQSDRHKPLNPC